jgi:hypothetical protein
MRRMRAAVCSILVSSAVVASAPWNPAVAATPCPVPSFGPGSAYRPLIEPASFTANVDNPWFPLKIGTTLVYAGTKDGKPAIDVVVASGRTRVIDGVETRIVEDRLWLDGVLEERTSDYYSQDGCGNVWYFGEDTAVLDRHGRVVDRSGSFHAGVDGAKPGLFMEAQPSVGTRFRQEWLPGQAEDTFRVVDLATGVRVPYGAYPAALRTEEKTVLEPNVLDNKYYVEGIGEVVERSVRGPREELRLVDVLA